MFCWFAENLCDFETSDLCEWTSYNADGAQWIWNTGTNPQLNNAPDIDHTFGKAVIGFMKFLYYNITQSLCIH